MCIRALIVSRWQPQDLQQRISERAKDLIRWSFDDVDPERLLDHHTHVTGIGTDGSGAEVNPRMQTWRHPFHRAKFEVYRMACGVQDQQNTDRQMIHRLVDLVRHSPHHGKYSLLAFDKHYRSDGTVHAEKTEFFVPNDYVFDLASQYPDLFEPVASVHPYRADAVQELEKCAVRGARMVKWLPNAMGMNPSSPQCDPFYRKMKDLKLTLLSHGGEEKAVESSEDQKLGNPLLLRRALDHGVRVVVAHCASLGTNEDLDSPGGAPRHNFELFLKLVENPKYEGLVWGEISAMTQFNRAGIPLRTILEREDLHSRLINGSDYPLPAIHFLIRIRPLIRSGMVQAELLSPLREIFHCNPLLFDYVLKRCLVAPGTKKRFPASVFLRNSQLFL